MCYPKEGQMEATKQDTLLNRTEILDIIDSVRYSAAKMSSKPQLDF